MVAQWERGQPQQIEKNEDKRDERSQRYRRQDVQKQFLLVVGRENCREGKQLNAGDMVQIFRGESLIWPPYGMTWQSAPSATPALMCDSFCDPEKVTQTLLLFLFLPNLEAIFCAVFPCCQKVK